MDSETLVVRSVTFSIFEPSFKVVVVTDLSKPNAVCRSRMREYAHQQDKQRKNNRINLKLLESIRVRMKNPNAHQQEMYLKKPPHLSVAHFPNIPT